MPKLTYIAYFINHFVFAILWIFLWLWALLQFSLSNSFTTMEFPILGSIFFGLAITGVIYGLCYIFIYELLPRIFKNSLGSLSVLPALLKINKYNMGSFGGGGGPSYSAVSNKYSEWIKEDNIEQKIKETKRKINTFTFSISVIGIVLYLVGYIFLSNLGI